MFRQYAGVCRLIWNLALEQRRDHWRQFQRCTGDNLNHVTQARQLTALRAEFDFIRAVSQDAQGRVLADLDSAFKAFFKGISGYPRPRKKGRDERFSFAGRAVRVEAINAKWAQVFIPKIGLVKFRQSRPLEGRITDAAIQLTALGWTISFGCAIDRADAEVGGSVGIDRGVAVPLMLSDGTSYALPTSIDVLEKRHRRAQRIVARRKRGSGRWHRAMKRSNAIKARQARIRKDWAHRATTDITRRFGVVVVERLRTKSMTRSAKGTLDAPGTKVAAKAGLNRAILNVGWHQIETMLTYKANNLIRINPAYTSQSCSQCGCIDSASRKNQATFHCTACDHQVNADLNAAKNILNRGSTSVLDVEGKHSIAPLKRQLKRAA